MNALTSGEASLPSTDVLPQMTEYKANAPIVEEKDAAKPDVRAIITQYMERANGMEDILRKMVAYEELPPGKWAEIRSQFLKTLGDADTALPTVSAISETNMPISGELKKVIAENSDQEGITELLGNDESDLESSPMVNLVRMREQFKDDPQIEGWFAQVNQYAERAGKILEVHKQVQDALKSEDSTQKMIEDIRAEFNKKYGEGEPAADSSERAKFEKDKEMKDRMEALAHGGDHSLLGEIFHYFISEMKGVSQL